MNIEVVKDRQVKITIGDVRYTLEEGLDGLRIQKYHLEGESDTLVITPHVSNVISVR